MALMGEAAELVSAAAITAAPSAASASARGSASSAAVAAAQPADSEGSRVACKVGQGVVACVRALHPPPRTPPAHPPRVLYRQGRFLSPAVFAGP